MTGQVGNKRRGGKNQSQTGTKEGIFQNKSRNSTESTKKNAAKKKR